ncbi:hypothetical protein BDA99DRAFT_85065 [Phascolomyces articulosus]|uniref:F-box domain-containing protein n=1 Tax=Phascolomyces articulosus TaxID=60185 RepID=A0AAD5K8D8_9FUNG|nr:hypothetical protein BDA99DRAFT_85065 [Phascolomyces articulosus]
MTFHSRNSKDPLSVLPLEILISIFQELSSGDRISCLGACRAWRDWMLKAPMVWINVEVSRSQANVIFNLLPRVGRHIENLELNWDANRFMTPIARGVFKNLKSLHVLGVKAPRGSYLEHDLCLKAFRKVSDTLTDL